MGKTIAGVFVGYIVMSIVVIALSMLIYSVLGPDRSFKPGSYEASSVWLGIATVINLLAAILGGKACISISKNRKAVQSLAGLVLVLGVVWALMRMGVAPPEGARPADLDMTEAMSQAQQPVVTLFLTPIIGAIGVMLGGLGLKQHEHSDSDIGEQQT